MAMRHTFTGLVLEFPNRGIHFLITETLTFRKQLVIRDEFKSQSGWNDAVNGWLKRQLEALAVTVKRITYNPSTTDPDAAKAARIAEAKDTTTGLAAAFDGRSINSDDLVLPASVLPKTVAFDLTGTHPDHPQPTHELIENDFARDFIIGLDYFVVVASQLDSRTQPATINAMEAAQLLALLNELYAICMMKGGEVNRVETPTGLMASNRVNTFNHDGRYDYLADPNPQRPTGTQPENPAP